MAAPCIRLKILWVTCHGCEFLNVPIETKTRSSNERDEHTVMDGGECVESRNSTMSGR
jgi:hypothetical protein